MHPVCSQGWREFAYAPVFSPAFTPVESIPPGLGSSLGIYGSQQGWGGQQQLQQHQLQEHQQLERQQQYGRLGYGSGFYGRSGEGYGGRPGAGYGGPQPVYRGPVQEYQRGDFGQRYSRDSGSRNFGGRGYPEPIGKPAHSGGFHLFGLFSTLLPSIHLWD